MKSVYYVVKELVESGVAGESSSNHQAFAFWKKIWQLNVPPKVKFFAWRVCLDGLPTMLNLRRRGLNTAGFCQICDKDLELISDSLFYCNHAKQTQSCWSDCPMNLHSPTQDIISITSQIMEKGSSTDLDLFFMAALSIWGNRNNAIHNDADYPPTQVWEFAKRSLIDFTTSTYMITPSTPRSKLISLLPFRVFTKLMLMGQQLITGNTLVSELLFETTPGPLLELSTSCFHQLSPLLSPRLLLCYKESFLLQEWAQQKQFLSLMLKPLFSQLTLMKMGEFLVTFCSI